MLKISTIAMVSGFTIVISGCASDVDKCVEAQVNAWKKGVNWQNSKTEEKVRVDSYLECLEAQGKN
jgi:hypothetical protein